MIGTVLILGASGRFGRNACDAFWNAGWTVRTFERKTDTLAQAARGVDVIVNAWNPPYHKWAEQLPALHAEVRKVALAEDATVVIPGNVYVFGADAPDLFSADTPHAAQNPLGDIRARMEAAYRDEGVRTIILRAGDFLDTEPSGNWFDKVMVTGLNAGVLTYPGPADVPHAWAFLPDLAVAAVELCEKRSELPRFADIPYPGYTMTGNQMAAMLSKVDGRGIRVKRMNWTALSLLRPVWKMARHLVEMRYLWFKSHRLDPRLLTEFLPGHRPTDPVAALSAATAHTRKVAPAKAA